MDTIAIHHHLGLGDHFLCNGLVRYLKETHKAKTILPAKSRNYETVKAMYADDPEIIILEYDNDLADNLFTQSNEWKRADKQFKIGHERTVYPYWDISFYDCANIPFSTRWTHFKVNRINSNEQNLFNKLDIQEPFILVHRNSSIGEFELDINTQYRTIEVTSLTENLLDWYKIIELAKEIHCIDSSFLHFAQSIKDKGFFHDIRRKRRIDISPPPQLNPTWTTINYENSV